MNEIDFFAPRRPCLSEDLASMGSLGSPFDAPLPRFHQAAAHLSNSLGTSSSKKPPLSKQLQSPCMKAFWVLAAQFTKCQS